MINLFNFENPCKITQYIISIKFLKISARITQHCAHWSLLNFDPSPQRCSVLAPNSRVLWPSVGGGERNKITFHHFQQPSLADLAHAQKMLGSLEVLHKFDVLLNGVRTFFFYIKLGSAVSYHLGSSSSADDGSSSPCCLAEFFRSTFPVANLAHGTAFSWPSMV